MSVEHNNFQWEMNFQKHDLVGLINFWDMILILIVEHDKVILEKDS